MIVGNMPKGHNGTRVVGAANDLMVEPWRFALAACEPVETKTIGIEKMRIRKFMRTPVRSLSRETKYQSDPAFAVVPATLEQRPVPPSRRSVACRRVR